MRFLQAGHFVEEEPLAPKAASPVSVVAQDPTEQLPPGCSGKGKGSMPPLQRADSVKQRTIQVGLLRGELNHDRAVLSSQSGVLAADTAVTHFLAQQYGLTPRNAC